MEEVSISKLLLAFGNYIRSGAYETDIRENYRHKGYSVPDNHTLTGRDVDFFLNKEENVKFHELFPVSGKIGVEIEQGAPFDEKVPEPTTMFDGVDEKIEGPIDVEGLENPPSTEDNEPLNPEEIENLENDIENNIKSASKEEEGDDDDCCVQTYPS